MNFAASALTLSVSRDVYAGRTKALETPRRNERAAEAAAFASSGAAISGADGACLDEIAVHSAGICGAEKKSGKTLSCERACLGVLGRASTQD